MSRLQHREIESIIRHFTAQDYFILLGAFDLTLFHKYSYVYNVHASDIWTCSKIDSSLVQRAYRVYTICVMCILCTAQCSRKRVSYTFVTYANSFYLLVFRSSSRAHFIYYFDFRLLFAATQRNATLSLSKQTFRNFRISDHVPAT